MFGRRKTRQILSASSSQRHADFSYLEEGSIYLDAACQSLRPRPVVDAQLEYYQNYNACGGRVKYEWGRKVDEAVEETRRSILKYLNLSEKNYAVSFTLNTTTGLNLLLQQLPAGQFQRIVTSDIEHNSVFLPTMTAAKRLGIKRSVLSRNKSGEVTYEPTDIEKAVVVVNVVSNIDGRMCGNIKTLVSDTHDRGGIVIIDAAQAMAHQHDILKGSDADAICFSGHKIYGASLGVVVAKKALLDILDYSIVGGGMVGSVGKSDFQLTPSDYSSRLEPGLQAWGEIVALGKAIEWLQTVRPKGRDRHIYIDSLSSELFSGLTSIPRLTVFNDSPSPVISVYSEKYDAHQLAIFLSEAGIMARSGYFCCHYYLHEKLKIPPLLRFSIGLHNTSTDIQQTIDVLKKLTS